MKNIFKSIRWASTLFLLYVIWQNAHWSVALSLTLISFSIEGIAAALDVHAKFIKANMELYKKFNEKI